MTLASACYGPRLRRERPAGERCRRTRGGRHSGATRPSATYRIEIPRDAGQCLARGSRLPRRGVFSWTRVVEDVRRNAPRVVVHRPAHRCRHPARPGAASDPSECPRCRRPRSTSRCRSRLVAGSRAGSSTRRRHRIRGVGGECAHAGPVIRSVARGGSCRAATGSKRSTPGSPHRRGRHGGHLRPWVWRSGAGCSESTSGPRRRSRPRVMPTRADDGRCARDERGRRTRPETPIEKRRAGPSDHARAAAPGRPKAYCGQRSDVASASGWVTRPTWCRGRCDGASRASRGRAWRLAARRLARRATQRASIRQGRLLPSLVLSTHSSSAGPSAPVLQLPLRSQSTRSECGL